MSSAFDRMPELTSNETTLLINFIDFSDRNGMTFVNANDIYANTREFGIRPIMLRATLDNLCRKFLLVMSNFEHQGSTYSYYEINPEYADLIESYFNFIRNSEYSALLSYEIPAADRFLAAGTFSELIDEVIDAVDALSASVQTAVSLFAGAEQRGQISEEFDAFRDILNKPQLHVAAVMDFAKSNTTLKWLAYQTAADRVKQLAAALFEVLERLIQSLTAAL